MAANLPLEGVRVLAIEQYGAGPYGTMYLADQGAEVIKIEDPNNGGDYSRQLGPYFFDNGDSEFWHSFNRNKRSLGLDLSTPDGQAVFHDLVATADAVTSNLRGDVPAKLKLTYGDLKQFNPKIVCAHLSAYGRTGSRASWPGFDFLMQAEAGLFSVTGEPDGPPSRCGVSVVDLMGGVALAFGIASGVLAARGSGEGRDLDVTLFDIGHALNVYTATWYLNDGVVQGRTARSGHASLTPCQLYKTGDGWVYIMCNKEKFWPALCEAIGKPEWSDDARFRSFKERLQNRDELQAMLDEVLSAKTTAEWMALFAGSVPASPINDLRQALDNPFVAERGTVQRLELEGHGPMRMLDTPVRGAQPTPANPAPGLGADTDDVLGGLGYDAERLASLRANKVISS